MRDWNGSMRRKTVCRLVVVNAQAKLPWSAVCLSGRGTCVLVFYEVKERRCSRIEGLSGLEKVTCVVQTGYVCANAW